MTYKDVNAGRLRWLLDQALAPEEVARFLKEKQKSLIMKGVKLQNLPNSSEARRSLLHRFSDGAHQILASWLEAQSDEGESTYAEQLLAWFRSIEKYGLKPPHHGYRLLARAGLKSLYANDVPAEWMAFLRSDIGSSDAPDEVASSSHQSSPDRETLTVAERKGFVAWFFGSTDVSEGIGFSLASAMKLVDGLKIASPADAPPAGISVDEWTELLNLKASASSRLPAAPSKGFRVATPTHENFDPDTDYKSWEVVCVPSRIIGNGPWFLEVLGFLRGRELVVLPHADLRRALPEEGRVILHSDAEVGPPTAGMADSYRVEGYASTKPIKVRATAKTRRLLTVVYVPHASTDPDAVRTWITRHSAELLSRPSMLILADGVAIRSRDDISGQIGTVQFQWKFDRWNSIAAVELGQNAYVVQPLPKPDDLFECPPVDLIARRLFKSFSDTSELGVSRAQLAKIAKRLSDPDLSMSASYRERVVQGVLTLMDSDAEHEALVTELMRSPIIQRDIETRKDQRLAEIDEETTDTRRRLEHLKKESQHEREKLDRLKKELETRIVKTDSAIRSAFESAREREFETIGKIALWTGLLGGATQAYNTQPTLSAENSHIAPPAIPLISSAHLAPDSSDLSSVLRSSGFDDDSSRLLMLALDVANLSRVPVLVSGIGARVLTLALARAMSRVSVNVVDVGLGCISPDTIRDALSDSSADVLLVRGVDHSDALLYAPDLVDLVVERIARPLRELKGAQIFMCRSQGPAALPLPPELEDLSIKLDLNRQSLVENVNVSREFRSPLQRRLYRRISDLLDTRDDARELAATILNMI